jgi:hypothetical protein
VPSGLVQRTESASAHDSHLATWLGIHRKSCTRVLPNMQPHKVGSRHMQATSKQETGHAATRSAPSFLTRSQTWLHEVMALTSHTRVQPCV